MRKQLVEEKPRERNDGPRRVKAQTHYLTPDGREKPDGTPVAPPIGYLRQPSMFERMREMVRKELSEAAQESGFETFEEADDFNIGDDYDPTSPYEELFEPPIITPGTKDGKHGEQPKGEPAPPPPVGSEEPNESSSTPAAAPAKQ